MNQASSDHDVVVDEICPLHGGHNFAYQYHNENFIRIAEICEGCNITVRQEPSSELQVERQTRQLQVRPHRPLHN